jgi:hypothetical protein
VALSLNLAIAQARATSLGVVAAVMRADEEFRQPPGGTDRTAPPYE